MTMRMAGAPGILAVPAEHLPGLFALAAFPFLAWLSVAVIHSQSRRGRSWAVVAHRRLDSLAFGDRVALFALGLGAAVHLCLVPTHWAQDRFLAVAFLADFLLSLGAAGLLWSGKRSGRLAAGLLLAGPAGAYAAWLLLGWESADPVGLLTSAVELTGALILLWPADKVARRPGWITLAAAPVALLTLLSAAAVAGPTEVAAARTTPPANLSLPTSSPAGAIVWPYSMSAMAPGMAMANPGCTASPTPAQQQAAVSLVDQTVTATAKYQSLDTAKAAGYVPVTSPGRATVHYLDRSALLSSSPLDPAAIPSLVYANTSHGAVLIAAMYLMPLAAAGQSPPQPGGCLTQWHIHTDLCFRGPLVVGTDNAAACPIGTANRVTQPMMHVWLAPVQGGPLTPDPPAASQIAGAYLLPAPDPANGPA